MVRSAYNQFVSEHMSSAPGKTAAEKMKAIAAKWRKMKGKGKSKGGLVYAPGHGRGIKLGRKKGKGGDYSDWGANPDMDGEGIWDDIIKPLGKKVLKKGVDLLVEKGGPALAKLAGKKSPLAEKIINLALEHGGSKLAELAKNKIEGLGVRHAHKWIKDHIAANPKKSRGRKGKAIFESQPELRRNIAKNLTLHRASGGALSGTIGPRQQAALNAYIKSGGSILHHRR